MTKKVDSGKLIGMLVISFLVISLFTPFVSFLSENNAQNVKAQESGLNASEDDWVITSKQYLNGTEGQNEFQKDCNIIIRQDGELHINNATLSLLIDGDGHTWNVSLENGGILKLWNSTLRTQPRDVQLRPFVKTDVTAKSGSTILMKHNSHFRFPGFVNIINSELRMDNSSFQRLSNLQTYNYLWDNQADNGVDLDDNNDCPRLKITDNSDFVMKNSEIMNYYENTDSDYPDEMEWYPLDGTGSPIQTLEEDDDNYEEVSDASPFVVDEWYLSNPIVPQEKLGDYPYINPIDRISSLYIEVTYKTEVNYTDEVPLEYYSPEQGDYVDALTITSSSDEQTKEADIWEVDLNEFDLKSYGSVSRLVNDLSINIENPNTADNSSIQIDELKLISAYENDIYIKDSKFTAINSYIDVDFKTGDTNPKDPVVETTNTTWREDSNTDHSVLRMINTDFKSYGLTVSPEEPDGGIQYGDPCIVNDQTSTNRTWIYRWLTVQVTNDKGVPIPGATVDATPINYESEELNQMVMQKNNLYNNTEAWDYLNKTGQGYYDIDNDEFVTGDNGEASMFLVTDRINQPEDWPNSKFVGNYKLNVSYQDSSLGIWENYSHKISFSSFPAMNESSNNKYYRFQIDVPYPDLRVEDDDLTLLSGSTEVTEIVKDKEVTIELTVHNVGDISASDINVSFYLDTISSNNLLNYTTISSLNVNESTTISSSWIADVPGSHTIIASVDPNNEIIEINETDNEAQAPLTINQIPDLVPTQLTLSNDMIEEDSMLDITATIENQGEGNADNVNISVYVDQGTRSEELISYEMRDIISGSDVTVTAQWNAEIIGEDIRQIRNISVNISDDDEINTDNNYAEKNVTVYRKSDLNFDSMNTTYSPDHLIQKGQEVNFSVELLNSGGWNGTVDVTLFDGEMIDANIINQTFVEIEPATLEDPSKVNTTLSWMPMERGYHDIHLVIDYENKLAQQSDMMSWTIPIFSENYEYDIIVDDDNSSRTITDEYVSTGFVVVEQDGTLTIGGTSRTTLFRMMMDRDNKYGIIVRDNGELIVDNAEIYPNNPNYGFEINVMDDAHLKIEDDSDIQEGVSLKAMGQNSPKVWINDSTVADELEIIGGELYIENSEFTSNTITINPEYIYARNSSFDAPLDDFVDTTGKLIGIITPSIGEDRIQVSGEGRIELHRWLRVDAESNASHPLTNAEITISSTDRDYAMKGYTNEDGYVYLSALTDIIMSDDVPFVGNYEIRGNYSEEGGPTYSYGPVMKSLPSYPSGETQTTLTLTFENIRFPDLAVDELSFNQDDITSGNELWINATIENEGVGVARQIQVYYYVMGDDQEYDQIGSQMISEIQPGDSDRISSTWITEMTNESLLEESRTIKVEINPDLTPLNDITPSNDFETSTILIRSPPQFDFTSDMQLLLDGTSYQQKTINEMDVLTIKTQVMNSGGTGVENASLDISINSGTIMKEKIDLSSMGMYNLSYDWDVNVTGSQTITILVESSEYSNSISKEIQIEPVEIIIRDMTLPKKPETNQDVSVSGVVVNDEGKELEGIRISAYLVNDKGNKKTSTKEAVTNENGYFMMTFKTPGEGGKYKIMMEPEVEGAGQIQSDDSFQVQGEEFPWWIVIAIVAVAIVGVVFVILYLTFFGEDEYVECGNCGATIPADSNKCPKCGVEFDTETVKCSECGEWIPVDADVCPECGAEFITTGEEVKEYSERMKNQYEKYKNKFRRKAEDEMGRTLTDEEFMDWWKDQPSYLTFDEWLEREEIKRKEGSIECPECGALNSVDDAVCQKCGSTLIEIEEEPEEEMEEAPEEMEETPVEEEEFKEEKEIEEEPEEKEEKSEKKIKKVKRVKKRPKKKRVKKKVIKEPSEKEESEEESE